MKVEVLETDLFEQIEVRDGQSKQLKRHYITQSSINHQCVEE